MAASAFAMLCVVGNVFASSQRDRELNEETKILFAPLDSDACRPVGEETATVLSFISPLAGFASLTVDWGDGRSNKFGSNIDSNVGYFYFHAYDEPGRYDIKTNVTVKQLNEDGTSWQSIENEMEGAVLVRNDCGGISVNSKFTENNRDGADDTTDVLSNWYDDVMAASIEFAPIEEELCLDAGMYAASTILVASLWSGYLSLNIDWGDDGEKHYSATIDRGVPYSFDHSYKVAGTYTINAFAVVGRLAINGKDYETIYEELSASVTVRDDCSADSGGIDTRAVVAGDDGVVTGEWSFFDFGPVDSSLCRAAGEEATALTLMSIFSGQLTVDVSCYVLVQNVELIFGFRSLAHPRLINPVHVHSFSSRLVHSACRYCGVMIRSINMPSMLSPVSHIVLLTSTNRPVPTKLRPQPRFDV